MKVKPQMQVYVGSWAPFASHQIKKLFYFGKKNNVAPTIKNKVKMVLKDKSKIVL